MNKKKKVIIISVCCIIFSGIVALAVYKTIKIPPAFEKMSEEKVLEYLKSGKVSNLDKEKLIKLGERLEKIPPEKRRGAMGTLSEKERRKSGGNRRLIAEAVLSKTVDEFFSLPPDKQDAFLDKQIQRMDERRANFAGFRNRPATGQAETATTQGNDGRTGRRTRNPDAMLQRSRDRLSETSPEERAKTREYFRRLMERRRQTRR